MIVLKCFIVNDGGVTAIEYALIAALIFLVIVTSVALVGQKTLVLYQNVGAAFP